MKLSLLTCLAWLLFSVHSMASNTDSAFIQHASTEVLQANTIVKADENPDETIEAKKQKSLITKLLDYFNDANKKTISDLILALSAVHTMPPTLSLV